MTIIAARYNDETAIPLTATLDTAQEVSMPSYPSGTHYDRQMAEFLDGGGVIAPYDPYHGMSLDEVKEIGYSAVDEEEVFRVDQAQHNPATGVNLSDSDTKRANAKRDNKAKKKVNAISDADDHLLDHIDILDDFAETLRDAIESCSDTDCVDDRISEIQGAAWPSWTPIA